MPNGEDVVRDMRDANMPDKRMMVSDMGDAQMGDAPEMIARARMDDSNMRNKHMELGLYSGTQMAEDGVEASRTGADGR